VDQDSAPVISSRMQLPAEPSNNAEAVAWAVIAVLRLAGWLVFAGAILAACVPDKPLLVFRVVRRALPSPARKYLRIGFHMTTFLGLHVVNTLHAYALARYTSVNGAASTPYDLLCAEDALRTIYSDPELVRALSTVVLCIYVAQFSDRVAALVFDAQRMSWLTRLSRACCAGILWVAAMDTSSLAPLLCLMVGVDLQLDHAAEFAEHVLPRYADRVDLGRQIWSAMAGAVVLQAALVTRECHSGSRRASAAAFTLGIAHVLPLMATAVASAAGMD